MSAVEEPLSALKDNCLVPLAYKLPRTWPCVNWLHERIAHCQDASSAGPPPWRRIVPYPLSIPIINANPLGIPSRQLSKQMTPKCCSTLQTCNWLS